MEEYSIQITGFYYMERFFFEWRSFLQEALERSCDEKNRK
jgi:hypothetical protein